MSNLVDSMFDFFSNNDCRTCGLPLEPETVATVNRMLVAPSDAEKKDYDTLIKDLKLSQGLCLGTLSLHQRYVTVYIRAAHDKQAALLDWTKNQYDGTEVGTIRFTAFRGVDGSTTSGNHYINNNYSQQQDYFSPSSKFGGYITSDYNNRILGYVTTAGGAGKNVGCASLSPLILLSRFLMLPSLSSSTSPSLNSK